MKRKSKKSPFLLAAGLVAMAGGIGATAPTQLPAPMQHQVPQSQELKAVRPDYKARKLRIAPRPTGPGKALSEADNRAKRRRVLKAANKAVESRGLWLRFYLSGKLPTQTKSLEQAVAILKRTT